MRPFVLHLSRSDDTNRRGSGGVVTNRLYDVETPGECPAGDPTGEYASEGPVGLPARRVEEEARPFDDVDPLRVARRADTLLGNHRQPLIMTSPNSDGTAPGQPSQTTQQPAQGTPTTLSTKVPPPPVIPARPSDNTVLRGQHLTDVSTKHER
jgi:hypothetical protein